MSDPLLWHRVQFAFTLIYHYLFPQLTIGLALVIVILKAVALRTGLAAWDDTARFWIRIFAINFVVGVVTGLPMEFQFGTNWARFSDVAGGVIGQTLAMEGMFAFFLESSVLGLLVFGERLLSRRAHFGTAVALLAGSWLSGYFIVTTNAFMQHPVGYSTDSQGRLHVDSLVTLLSNSWAVHQYLHTIVAAVVTGAFVVAAVGAYYSLSGLYREHARICLRVGTTMGLFASVLVAFPTGDRQAKLVAAHQPVTLAAMEGRFESGPMADIVIIGQPNVRERRLDNPIQIPGILSVLTFGHLQSNVRGLAEFPTDVWPDNIELLYYAFHIMAGLGTLFILLMGVAALLEWRGRLESTRGVLWMLMLAFPFPYIANTTGWMTAELGRQPWLVYNVMRTADGASPLVHSGTVLFTLIGFAGLYFVIGLLFLYLISLEIARGPGPARLVPAATEGESGHG